MKLIDLLVQELHKHGGWPIGAKSCVQSVVDNEIYFYDKPYDGSGCMVEYRGIYLPTADETGNDEDGLLLGAVTRKEYEEALTKTKTMQWDGKGFPPVGCVCEALYDSRGETWYRAKVIAYDGMHIIGRWLEGSKANELLDYPISVNRNVRRSRTEVERKRDEVIEEMTSHVTNFNKTDVVHAITEIYDAALAGKIKGLRVE